MSKTFEYTGKRGRPKIELNIPLGKFTVNDLVAINPHVKCRLSVYTHLNKLVNRRVIRSTGKTIPSGSVIVKNGKTIENIGKPLNVYQRVSQYRAIKARKANAKASTLVGAVVDLTPAPVAPAPVTA